MYYYDKVNAAERFHDILLLEITHLVTISARVNRIPRFLSYIRLVKVQSASALILLQDYLTYEMIVISLCY